MRAAGRAGLRGLHAVVSIGASPRRLPIDTFLLLLLVTIGVATLLPARGAAADLLSLVTKVAIGVLFALYGARLSPAQALHGVRQWRLQVMVLAVTFVAFPLLGLAARKNVAQL